MPAKPVQQRERDTATGKRDGPTMRKGAEVQDKFAEQVEEILSGDQSEDVSDSEINRLFEAVRRLPPQVDGITMDFADEMGRAFLHADLLGRSQVGDILQDEDEIAEFSAPNALAGVFTPDEAFRWISAKISITRPEFDALSAELQQQAFTVARAANVQQIEQMRTFLERQLVGSARVTGAAPGVPTGSIAANPISKRAFIKKFKDRFSEPHLETVFRTNVFSNFEAGKREMLLKGSNRGFVELLQIVTARDFRVRDDHRPLNGFAAPPDDPIWQTVYPPFSWNCRCTVVGRSARMVERSSLKASPSSHAAYRFNPDFPPPTRLSRLTVTSQQARKADETENRVRR